MENRSTITQEASSIYSRYACLHFKPITPHVTVGEREGLVYLLPLCSSGWHICCHRSLPQPSSSSCFLFPLSCLLDALQQTQYHPEIPSRVMPKAYICLLLVFCLQRWDKEGFGAWDAQCRAWSWVILESLSAS